VALAFGLWDAAAPLAGMIAGHFLGRAIGPVAELAGATALGAYGLYLLARAWRSAAPEEFHSVRALVTLPLPLSLDNVAAGTSLGLLGFSPWVAAPTFGAITAVMSLAGLLLGRAVAYFVRIRCDALTGAALVVIAAVMALAAAR
jgi:putative Mn2+ efflux pump MntP